MSQWTHINGSIRIDAMRNLVPCISIKKLEEMIKVGAPKGSEGGLSFLTWENPDKNAAGAYTICFFGDLRDVGKESLTRIFAWFKVFVESLDIHRSAIMEVDVESDKKYIYTAVSKDGKAELFEVMRK